MKFPFYESSNRTTALSAAAIQLWVGIPYDDHNHMSEDHNNVDGLDDRCFIEDLDNVYIDTMVWKMTTDSLGSG